MKQIAICIPSIRQESLSEWFNAWEYLFDKHQVRIYVTIDGETPFCYRVDGYNRRDLDTPPEVQKLIFNFSDVCRNLSFFHAAQEGAEVFISMDDDIRPLPGTDPIQEHLDALGKPVILSWMNTAHEHLMRDIPYGIRTEATTVLSHGVWKGVPDMDAPTQLLNPYARDLTFYRGPVPNGIYFPVCAMNFAFTRELLPWVYQAPMGIRLEKEFSLPKYDRFGDIWAGVVMKHAIDNVLTRAAAVTGYSTIEHIRASNVFANLRKEAVGMELNETFVEKWTQKEKKPGSYVHLYESLLGQWQNAIAPYV